MDTKDLIAIAQEQDRVINEIAEKCKIHVPAMDHYALETVLYSPEQEMIEQLEKISTKIANTNDELKAESVARRMERESYEERLLSLQAELEKINISQRWQTLKDFLIGVAGAIIGIVLTVIATKFGWL